MNCPECGVNVDNSGSFCTACGSKLSFANNQNKSASFNKWFISAAMIIAVIAIGFYGYKWFTDIDRLKPIELLEKVNNTKNVAFRLFSNGDSRVVGQYKFDGGDVKSLSVEDGDNKYFYSLDKDKIKGARLNSKKWEAEHIGDSQRIFMTMMLAFFPGTLNEEALEKIVDLEHLEYGFNDDIIDGNAVKVVSGSIDTKKTEEIYGKQIYGDFELYIDKEEKVLKKIVLKIPELEKGRIELKLYNHDNVSIDIPVEAKEILEQ